MQAIPTVGAVVGDIKGYELGGYDELLDIEDGEKLDGKLLNVVDKDIMKLG